MKDLMPNQTHKENKTDETKQQKELNSLKEEILREINPQKSKKRLNWGSVIVTSTLILLLSISIVQTAQSASILTKVKSGEIKSAATASSANSALPASLQDLPDMVGGC